MKSLRSRMMHFIRRWHAKIGVATAVFFLLLATSGVALNHTDSLHLAKTPVQSAWLMRWYGLKPEIPTTGYMFRHGYFVASSDHWVLNGRDLQDLGLPETRPQVAGVVAWGDELLAIASAEHLFLFTADGKQVDHLYASALPAPSISRLGVTDTKLALETADGIFVTSDGLEWQKTASADDVDWAAQQALPESVSAKLSGFFSPSLPLERIVLDVHSGRIFGRYGPLLMDLAALVLIVLSMSGLWIYIRTSRKRNKP